MLRGLLEGSRQAALGGDASGVFLVRPLSNKVNICPYTDFISKVIQKGASYSQPGC